MAEVLETPDNSHPKSGVADQKADQRNDHDPAFSGRIEQVIRLAGSVAELARKSGLSERVISKYRSGESDPSRRRLLALAEASGVSVEWLATGKTATGKTATGKPIEPVSENKQESGDFALVPRFDARLSAGAGAFTERTSLLDHIPFTQRFLRRNLGRSAIEGLAIVEAVGDSMEPTISNGDLVMIDRQDTVPGDGLYALVLDDSLLVKRVHKTLDGLEITSDNSALYRPITLPRARIDDVMIVGRVRWLGRAV
ncbi:LexA family transcriptional regulator [Algihabitans sp.]|uniref:LexA family transcriptional regulator n=1 Tax=Algihabitans sp. TaxID=2821514 RepID=UPI003BA914FC